MGVIEGDVARRVAGHIQHLPVQTQGVASVAAMQRDVGLGNGFKGRAEHGSPRGEAQLGHAAGVVGVVVRD